MTQRKEISNSLNLFLLFMLIILSSCENPSIDRSVDPLPVDLDLIRLDIEVFKEENSAVKHLRLRESYPNFYSQYFREILLLGSLDDSLATNNLSLFIEDPEWQFAQSQIDSVFNSSESLENDFKEAFGRYASIFSSRSIPDVYIMNSGFNYGVYPIPPLDILGIGAEFYIGQDNPMIARLPNEMFPAYLREQMNPDQMLPNALKGWIILNHKENMAKTDLLGLMVTYGKIMYTLHLCIPDIPEYRHFAYTEAQLNWCKTNEENIWKVIIDEDILFTTDKKTLTDWIGRGPYTQGFSEESPAELAYFMGKQIVKDYMEEHPELSVEELIEIPAEAILKEYTPG